MVRSIVYAVKLFLPRLRLTTISIFFSSLIYTAASLSIYVLDNWLAHPIHKKVDESLKGARWGKSNEVRGDDPTGLPMHQFWGASMYCDDNWSDEVDNGIILWSKYLNERVGEDFGFEWENFQYMGGNSQTQGLYGTIHTDCPLDEDQNLSFLYYTNTHWEDHWGGVLRLYETPEDDIIFFEAVVVPLSIKLV